MEDIVSTHENYNKKMNQFRSVSSSLALTTRGNEESVCAIKTMKCLDILRTIETKAS